MSSNLLSNLENSIHFSNLARTSSLEKSYQKSEIFLKLAIKYNPDSPQLFYEIALVLYLQENFLDSLLWIEKTIELIAKLREDIVFEIITLRSYILKLQIFEVIKEKPEKIKEVLISLENDLEDGGISLTNSKEILNELKLKVTEIDSNSLHSNVFF